MSEPQQPQQPPLEQVKLVNAINAFQSAFIKANSVPSPSGVSLNIDLGSVVVQSHIDRIAVEVLIDSLVASGDLNKAAFALALAAKLEAHAKAMLKPRILVPK